LVEAATRHLEHADEEVMRIAAEVRLAAAEAALVTPDPGAAAGLVATRLRRGVAVAADGEPRAPHARPAGRALAAPFPALHALRDDPTPRTDVGGSDARDDPARRGPCQRPRRDGREAARRPPQHGPVSAPPRRVRARRRPSPRRRCAGDPASRGGALPANLT